MRKGWIALTIVGAFAAMARAQTPPGLEALEKEIEAERTRLGIPGLALAVVQDDKVIFAKGFGYRDVEKKLPVTPETLFAIGSVTKSFTAASVLMAVDAGKVSLDDRPRKFLPYFKMRDPQTDARITVRDLMRHASGLPRTDLLMLAGEKALGREGLIRATCAARPTAKLGEKFQYQNVMFSAAGEVASKAFGLPYEKLVAQRIFAPLGMTGANLSVPRTLATPDHAVGYQVDPETKKASPLPMRAIDSVPAAGAINASAQEMTRWVRLMLGGGAFEGKRLLSEKSFQEMTSPQMSVAPKVGYGLGWMLREWKGLKVVEHGGNIDGFNAEVGWMPERKLGFVLLTNVSNSPLGQGILNLVWKNLAAPPAEVPAPPPVDTGPAVEPQEEAGVYTLMEAPIALTVSFADGKLSASVPGQPTYPLERILGRRYKFGAPAPAGFFATFRPAKDKPGQVELFLEQPQGNAIFVRDPPAPAAAPIAIDELRAKATAAAGGEANLRRHVTRYTRATIEFENQGMVGVGEAWAQVPCRTASRLELSAAGKKLGWLIDWFDGTQGGQAGSFLPATPLGPREVAQAKIASDFADALLLPAARFERVALARTEVVEEKEYGIPAETCYVLELKARGAAPVRFYFSTKTFRLLRKDIPQLAGPGSVAIPVPELYGDFREVDGVQVPFLSVLKMPAMGALVSRIREVRFDVPVDPALFAGPKRK